MAYFDVSDFFFVPVLQLGEGQFYLQVLGFKRLWSIEQSLRPFKTMGYGLGRSPLFVVGNTMGNK